MRSCNLCKWSENAPAGKYCVNPAIPGNRVAIAVDGYVNGMSFGRCMNECASLRTPIIGSCGLSGSYFELRTTPDCISGDGPSPKGGNYVEWAKRVKHQYGPETEAMLDKYISDNESRDD